MIRSGLVSVTFRQLSVEEIVALALEAGIDGVEWGGDVHVPHGDIAKAREVRALTEAAGLRVASYGSYYRVGSGGEPEFSSVLQTALALGAPTIRVWAGNRSSTDADAACRETVAGDSRRIAGKAAEAGVTVAYEYHSGTLTDTPSSAAALLDAVNHPNMFSYWQPFRGLSQKERVDALEALLPRLANLHVHWHDETGRAALEAGRTEWTEFLELASGACARERFALIEFVKDDTRQQFLEDAKVLRAMLA